MRITGEPVGEEPFDDDVAHDRLQRLEGGEPVPGGVVEVGIQAVQRGLENGGKQYGYHHETTEDESREEDRPSLTRL